MNKNTKICPKCQVEKLLGEFHPDTSRYDGVKGWCKACIRESCNAYGAAHRKEKRRYAKAYHIKYKDEENDRIAKWKKDHPENVKACCTRYRKNHLDHFSAYRRTRGATDLNFRLAENLRRRLWNILHGRIKRGSAVKDLGCSVADLKLYLEQRFQSGMTWDNCGEFWEIDHIRPLSSFDLTDRAQFLQAVHYSNLKPLRIEENRSKGSLYNGTRYASMEASL